MSSLTHRYIPQSPTPYSPPRTPSPSSGTQRSDAKLLLLQRTPQLDTPATTPEEISTPYHPPPYHPRSTISTELEVSTSLSQNRVIGMGINIPGEGDPRPAEEKSLDAAIGTDMTRSLTDPSNLSPGTSPARRSPSGKSSAFGSNLLSASPQRSRSISPAPINLINANNGFASSSSYYTGTPGTEQRERIISPTKPSFDTVGGNDVLPVLQTQTLGPNALSDQQSPIWSSAIDGRKEPSIKPAAFGYENYEPTMYAHQSPKNRTRSPYIPGQAKAEYQAHPLSGVAYSQTARDAQAGGTAVGEGGFYDSAAYWLGLYFFFNLGLTLFNKVVLVSFPFPYTLTGLHALSGCAGCYIALERGAFTPARLTTKESMILAAFSVLYTINIAVSNISLQLVTVPFHQVVRASTPLFTIIISTVVLRTRFSAMKLVSLLPVVAGVGFATYGDYYFTAWGLILTLLGTFLAALKTVVTNLIQTGGGQRLKLHPLDLLMRMSPLAFIQCVAYGWYTGELERVRQYGATQMTRSKAVALLVNGVIACGLNIVSFTANKKAGALTMTVSANCKQVLTIALAVVLFDLNISPTNGVGILLTLIGGGWYGYVEYTEKKMKNAKIADRS